MAFPSDSKNEKKTNQNQEVLGGCLRFKLVEFSFFFDLKFTLFR